MDRSYSPGSELDSPELDRFILPATASRVVVSLILAVLLESCSAVYRNAMVRPTNSAITEYLKDHGLPGVGAQIIDPWNKTHRVLLYGFVGKARDFSEAEERTHEYFDDTAIQLVNRIKIDPRLLATSNSADSSRQVADHQSYDADQKASSSTGGSNMSASSRTYPLPPVGVGDVEEYKAHTHIDDSSHLYQRNSVTIGSILMGLILGGPIPYRPLEAFPFPLSPPPSYSYAFPSYYTPPSVYTSPSLGLTSKSTALSSGFRAGWFGGQFGYR